MTCAQTNLSTKPQVADRIRKVEDDVDEFQKYLNNRGEDAKNGAASAQSSGATALRQSADSANTGTRRNQAEQTKDDLEDAMDDLNRSTNRLRRKFDPTSNYLETKALKGITARRQSATGCVAHEHQRSCAVLQPATHGRIGTRPAMPAP